MWAFGVVMFALLTGKMPFTANFEEDLNRKISSAKYSFPLEPQISCEEKQIIASLLNVSASKRITVQELSADPYFKSDGNKV